ncbi:MAG: RHS repeat-associated core domain-containing protein [Verrucomicrobiota bacterium]|jgi:RHS repeat-associated protein
MNEIVIFCGYCKRWRIATKPIKRNQLIGLERWFSKRYHTRKPVLATVVGFLILIVQLGKAQSEAEGIQSTVNRTVPVHAEPLCGLVLSGNPTTEEIQHVRMFPELLIPTAPASAEDSRALGDALRTFSQRAVRDDFSPLEGFISANPDSAWTASLRLNLGLEYYHTGWYSKALDSLEEAWSELKNYRDPKLKALADRAVGELAFMYARIGRMQDLASLLASLKTRTLVGPGRELVAGAEDGLWTMQNTPEIAFRCGPLALDSIIAFKNPGKGGLLLMQYSKSTTNGFSLSQVAALSRKAGLNYQMAFRTAGSPIIMPAVVHWKVGHYAALLREENGLYLLRDPTFRNDAWITARDLDEEASGYCLVPQGDLPNGWRPVSESEGVTIWGKGQTSSSKQNANTPVDIKTPAGTTCPGMAVSSVFLLDVSLNIEDNPVGYTPPVGPAVRLVVNYNQLESDQPANFNYSNFGPQWTFNYLAYITDDPSSPLADVDYYTDGGGTLPFSGFNATSQSFAPQIQSQVILTRTSANSYQMLLPDGSKYIFNLPTATNGTSRNVFLTQIVDPQGNAVQITYDSNFRVIALTDAIGQVTTFSYNNPNDNLEITKVTDPFGRSAIFAYDSENRLWQITDCVGLTSQFTYDSGDDILAMTTPYGTTSYVSGVSTDPTGRGTWLETTYPDGEKDRVEFSEATDVGTDAQDPASTVPQGMYTRNWVMYGRDTYFWDRHAYPAYLANTNSFATAYNYHWLHDTSETEAYPVLESVKPALENRTWYNYPGQGPDNADAAIVGSSDHPSVIGRVLDDGSTQLRQFSYNALGNITNSIDPVGRSMTYVYSTNLVDLIQVRQTTGASNDLLGNIQYNTAHRPVAIYDASGQLTTNTYNVRGQILSITDAEGETTTFAYDSNGYLVSITGPLQSANDVISFNYDNVGRIRTITNVDGYTLTYSYDNMDRITNITHPDGTFEAFTYSNLDLLVSQDRLGRQTISTFDSLRRRIAVQDPLGRVTRFEYCGCGLLDAIIDAMGQETSWAHDIEGRLTSKRYADGSTVIYNYENTTSRLKSVVDERNQYKAFSYNQDDTVSSISYPNAVVPTPTVSFTYDPNYKRLTAMQDGIGTTIYSYNPVTIPPSIGAVQLASVTGPLPNSTTTYQYDQLARETNRTINGVSQVVTFDVLGRPVNVTNALGSFQCSFVDATPRLASTIYPNGQEDLYSYYNILGDRRLQQIQHLKPGAALLSSHSYAYNAIGQITAWTNQWDTIPVQIWFPTYDAADQLTNVVSSGGPSVVTNYFYAYDRSGNRLVAYTNGQGSTYAYNSLNQLIDIASNSTGNISYQWDAENRLTAVNNGSNRSEFSYDGLGRRVGIVEKTNGVVQTSNYYLWCGPHICEIRDASGANVLRRLFPQGEALVGTTGNTNYFYTRDHLGSVREAVGANGLLATRYNYDPYGHKSLIQENLQTTFGFTGDFVHQKSGLYLTLFRALDSTSGRWLARDPKGEALNPNLYLYVNNNPINGIDKLGDQCSGAGTAGGGGGGGTAGGGSGGAPPVPAACAHWVQACDSDCSGVYGRLDPAWWQCYEECLKATCGAPIH